MGAGDGCADASFAPPSGRGEVGYKGGEGGGEVERPTLWKGDVVRCITPALFFFFFSLY